VPRRHNNKTYIAKESSRTKGARTENDWEQRQQCFTAKAENGITQNEPSEKPVTETDAAHRAIKLGLDTLTDFLSAQAQPNLHTIHLVNVCSNQSTRPGPGPT
jgi:hypothetical protein